MASFSCDEKLITLLSRAGHCPYEGLSPPEPRALLPEASPRGEARSRLLERIPLPPPPFLVLTGQVSSLPSY
jgi:hypothetical protein